MILPDLILKQIQLPSMDDYRAIQRIGTDPAFFSVPIIAVTSDAPSGKETESTLRRAATTFKPYSPRQLLAKIRQYLPDKSRSIAAVQMSLNGTKQTFRDVRLEPAFGCKAHIRDRHIVDCVQ